MTQPTADNDRQASGPVALPQPVYRWYHKASAVLLVSLYLYIGVFLTLFPWTDFWDINYFSQVVPEWHLYWGSGYVRGAVSSVGLLNLYFALAEIFRLRRFAKRR